MDVGNEGGRERLYVHFKRIGFTHLCPINHSVWSSSYSSVVEVVGLRVLSQSPAHYSSFFPIWQVFLVVSACWRRYMTPHVSQHARRLVCPSLHLRLSRLALSLISWYTRCNVVVMLSLVMVAPTSCISVNWQMTNSKIDLLWGTDPHHSWENSCLETQTPRNLRKVSVTKGITTTTMNNWIVIYHHSLTTVTHQNTLLCLNRGWEGIMRRPSVLLVLE